MVLDDGIVEDALVDPVVLGLEVELWLLLPFVVPLTVPVPEAVVAHGAGVLVVAPPVPVMFPDPVVEFPDPVVELVVPAAPVVVDMEPDVLVLGVVPVVLGFAPDGVLVVVLGVVADVPVDGVLADVPGWVDGVAVVLCEGAVCAPIVELDPAPGVAVEPAEPATCASPSAAKAHSAPASKYDFHVMISLLRIELIPNSQGG